MSSTASEVLAESTASEKITEKKTVLFFLPLSNSAKKIKIELEKNQEYEVFEATSGPEVIQVLKMLGPLVVGMSPMASADFEKQLTFLKAATGLIKRGMIKPFLFYNKAPESVLKSYQKYGVRELVQDAIPFKGFMMKLKRLVNKSNSNETQQNDQPVFIIGSSFEFKSDSKSKRQKPSLFRAERQAFISFGFILSELMSLSTLSKNQIKDRILSFIDKEMQGKRMEIWVKTSGNSWKPIGSSDGKECEAGMVLSQIHKEVEMIEDHTLIAQLRADAHTQGALVIRGTKMSDLPEDYVKDFALLFRGIFLSFNG